MLAPIADYELEIRGETLVVHPKGDWTINQAGVLDGRLASDVAAMSYRHVDYDMAGIGEMDTAGAYLLARAIRYGVMPAESWEVVSNKPGHKTLMNTATSAVLGQGAYRDGSVFLHWRCDCLYGRESIGEFWCKRLYGRSRGLRRFARTGGDYHGDPIGRAIGFILHSFHWRNENASGNRRYESHGLRYLRSYRCSARDCLSCGYANLIFLGDDEWVSWWFVGGVVNGGLRCLD